MKFNFFILFLLIFFSVTYSQDDATKKLDSIRYYLMFSASNTDLPLDKKLSYANRANVLAIRYRIDSLILKSHYNLAAIQNEKNNETQFLRHSHLALKKALKIKDSSALAKVYKSLGYHYFTNQIDSAYYYNNKAEKLFFLLGDDLNRAKVILDIAILQKEEKDLTGSELTSINGLMLLDKLDETKEVIKYQSYFYDNLAQTFRTLGQFKEAIDYQKKAIDKIKKLTINEQLLNTYYNDLALTYKDFGNYELALKYYTAILKDTSLMKTRPDVYALYLDNYAHALFLSNDYEKLPNLFHRALKICDSVNNESYTIIMYQHLAQYYLKMKNIDSAKYYAYRSKEISENYSPYDLLRSYALLSEIEVDSVAVKYYAAYVKLNDSLVKNERATRNKFARIQYETDKIEEENIQIARERMWLLIISIVLIIASFLIYVIFTQRNKNKELVLVQKQQEANEEIYNLMLSQHENIEEARALEKKRISQELHDGVLGRLFGARLSLDSLNMATSMEAINTRGQYISELKNIEQDIRKVSHELNTDFVSGSGFIDIINTLVDTQTAAYALKYKLDFDETINWDGISNKNKIHVYRIVQESLHNIYKHAHASMVKISFKLKNNVICLTVKDNGSGFDVDKVKSGIGLKNMNSRINEINGSIEIASKKGKGTTVKITVPI